MTKYYMVSVGNGYCGCDEEFLVEDSRGRGLNFSDILSFYSYADGAIGLDIGEDKDCDCTFEEYEENIFDNICFVEIDEENFVRLRDEESWEVFEK